MPQLNDLSRSLVALDQDSTIIAVVELSQSSWLVGGVLPGIERQPQKKLEPSAERLLGLLHRWRDEAVTLAFIVSDLLASGELVPLLPEYSTPETEIVALYPHRRQLSAKVRLFLDRLVDRFAEEQRSLGVASDR